MKISTELKLFATVWLVYGFYVTMTDQRNNVDALCVAIVDHHTFEVDPGVFSDYALVDGKRYSGYSPGASWLLAPYYFASKPLTQLVPTDLQFQAFAVTAGLLVTIPLGALCVVALYRLLREWGYEERTCLLTALALAFGTMWFAYSRRHNSYSFISAAFIFLSFYALKRAECEERKAMRYVGSGLLALLAVTVDYKQAISAFWLCLYVLVYVRSLRSLLWFVVGALPPTAAMLAYNWHVFGHPLYTPSKFEVANHGEDIALQPGVIPLEGALKFDWGHFWRLLAGPHTGFFVYMPVMILALIGLAFYLRHRPPASRGTLLVTAGIFFANLVLSASLPLFWYGGGAGNFYGPATRYLLPAVPFLALFMASAVQRLKRTAVYSVTILSFAITWIFVLSANYGKGESRILPGFENLPLVVHGEYIAQTFGAESVWFHFLSSTHFSLGKPVAAAVTWTGAALVGVLVWRLWRPSKTS